MNFKTKPVIAGVVTGAVLAAGGIAAIDLSSDSAQAQGGTSAAQAAQKADAASFRASSAIRKANTLQNSALKYLLPAGQQIGAKQPPGVITPEAGTGTGGLPLSTLSPGVQNLQVYNANYYYNNANPSQVGRALEDVQRNAVGDYYFKWPINVSECSVQASPQYYAGMNPAKGDYVAIYQAPNPNWWQIKYYGYDAAQADPWVAKDGPVSVYVQCGTGTTSNN